jgi:two-component system LytT family response regulator
MVLVDDEQPARDHLRELLATHTDVEIVGEAEDGEQGLELISKLRPDLAFLDIQMPGCSGLEVAASLPLPRPKIVFCTAFDEYAVKAFEVHALDYLLKPANRARLAAVINRIRQNTTQDQDAAVDTFIRDQAKVKPRFLARQGIRYRVIAQPEISFFSIEGGLTALHLADERCWMDSSLAELERRLDPAEFVRISREVVVRMGAISEVLPLPSGHTEIVLRSGDRLRVSRRRVKDLLDRLGLIR